MAAFLKMDGRRIVLSLALSAVLLALAISATGAAPVSTAQRKCVDLKPRACARWGRRFCGAKWRYHARSVAKYWCRKTCKKCIIRKRSPPKRSPPKRSPPKLSPPKRFPPPLKSPRYYARSPPLSPPPRPYLPVLDSLSPPIVLNSPPPPEVENSPPPPTVVKSPPPPEVVNSPPPPKVVLSPPPPKAASPPQSLPSGAPGSYGTWLASLLTVTDIPIDPNNTVFDMGYNGVPIYRRIDTAISPAGHVYFARNSPAGVRVTRLSTDLSRSAGPDTVIPDTIELGGLVAHDDGFAVLARRGLVARLIRYKNELLFFDKQLTGIDSPSNDQTMEGAAPARLQWNGHFYGAYMVIHEGGHYGDKLIYLDANGIRVDGGWNWGCSHNIGGLLLATDQLPFVALCAEDARSGIYVMTIGFTIGTNMLTREECWAGYCGGEPGGVVRITGGYVVAYTSRGVSSGAAVGGAVKAKWDAHQVALSFLDETGTKVVRGPVYLTTSPSVDHANVRIMNYGADGLLLTYESIRVAKCEAGTCKGEFEGTHYQLLDLRGNRVSGDAVLDAGFPGEFGVLPNGDVVWAYVEAKKIYTDYNFWVGQPDTVDQVKIGRISLGG